MHIEKIVLVSDEDCCGRNSVSEQALTVEFADGGGGFYAVLSTERFALSKEDFTLFVKLLNGIIDANDLDELVKVQNAL